MRVKFLFAWYDAWVGAFVDTAKRRLYLFPVPCLGLYIEFPNADDWRVWKLKWLPVQRIRDLDGTLKLTRFKLTPAFGRLGQLYLHRFHGTESDMPMHDHAYNFWTMPLGQGYWEITRGVNAAGKLQLVYLPPWRINRRPAAWAHVVDGPKDEHHGFPFWTLFWQGPQIRKWGFYLGVTWVYWKDYYASQSRSLPQDG